MEKRHFTRTDFETVGAFRVGARRVSFVLIDVSLKGALVSPEDPAAIRPGLSGVVEIRLPGSEVTITAEGTCVHEEADHRGFRFNSIDAESMTHLRRLLELNTGRGDGITSELSFLADPE